MTTPEGEPQDVHFLASFLVSPEELPALELSIRKALSELGAVAVSKGAPHEERLTPEDEEFQAILDTDLATVFFAEPTPRFANALQKDNVQTIRDVLVVGRRIVGGLRNSGDKLTERLEERLGFWCPGETWQTEPDMETIVRLCPTLDEVTTAVLGETSLKGVRSIRSILSLPEEVRLKILGRTEERYDAGNFMSTPEQAQRVLEKATLFAELFNREKLRQMEGGQ